MIRGYRTLILDKPEETFSFGCVTKSSAQLVLEEQMQEYYFQGSEYCH
jgi:hypothetical protein